MFDGPRRIGDQLRGDLLRRLRVEPLGAVDQLELAPLLLRVGLELRLLDLDLVLEELARALHREPLAERHRARAGQEPGESGDQDRAPGELGAGDAHDQREVRHQPVVGAEHRGAQGVAARRAMAPLELGEGAALHAAGALRRDHRRGVCACERSSPASAGAAAIPGVPAA